MKARINGTTYNTRTAREEAGISSFDRSAGLYRRITLYRTPTGHAFLHGDGGSHAPGVWRDGEGYIVPVTDAEARIYAAHWAA